MKTRQQKIRGHVFLISHVQSVVPRPAVPTVQKGQILQENNVGIELLAATLRVMVCRGLRQEVCRLHLGEQADFAVPASWRPLHTAFRW